MAIRLNTTNPTGTSPSWAPAGTVDMLLQSTSTGDISGLIIELQTQLNASAPWVGVITTNLLESALIACLHLPTARLVWSGNKGTLMIWDIEP